MSMSSLHSALSEYRRTQNNAPEKHTHTFGEIDNIRHEIALLAHSYMPPRSCEKYETEKVVRLHVGPLMVFVGQHIKVNCWPPLLPPHTYTPETPLAFRGCL